MLTSSLLCSRCCNGHAARYGRSEVRGPTRVRPVCERFMALGLLAPDLGNRPIVARALAGRELGRVAFEVLHSSAHVEREIEHPLLVVALRAQVADHPTSPVLNAALRAPGKERLRLLHGETQAAHEVTVTLVVLANARGELFGRRVDHLDAIRFPDGANVRLRERLANGRVQ